MIQMVSFSEEILVFFLLVKSNLKTFCLLLFGNFCDKDSKILIKYSWFFKSCKLVRSVVCLFLNLKGEVGDIQSLR